MNFCGTTGSIAGLQRKSIQEREIPGDQYQLISKNHQAQNNHDDAADDLYEAKVFLNAVKNSEKSIQCKRHDQERNTQAHGIDHEETDAL